MPTTVLLVLEDGEFREHLLRELNQCGCQVLPVRSAHSALIVLRQFPGDINLLITAEELPGMSGAQLGRIAAREREQLGVVFVKGALEDVLHQVQLVLNVPRKSPNASGSYGIVR